MSHIRKALGKPFVFTFSSLVVATALSGCGDSSSLSTVPILASDSGTDASRTPDWGSSEHLWNPRRSRPRGGRDSSPSPSPEPSASDSAEPTTPTPTPTPSASPTPASLMSPVAPSPTASPKPSAAPSATPTVSPTSTPLAPPLAPYDPPGGVYPLFPSGVFQQRLPANPTVNVNSSAWMATLGSSAISSTISFAGTPAGLPDDYTFPIYPMNSLASGSVPVKVHCRETYGTCNIEGKTVYVDLRELPEDGGTAGKDSHMALVDAVGGREYDFWGTRWPPSNGTLSIAWGGSCTLSGNGYDGCSSTATSTPLSEGIIRVSDLFAAMATPTGSLPYAIQSEVKCTDGSISPMLGGDGHTAGCAPEGSRVYLAMHDAEVDASGASQIAKAILRTIDEDHYGLIITDINGGQDGFGLAVESDLTYTAFGFPGPLVNRLVPEAKAEGLHGTGVFSNGMYYLQIPYTGIDFADKMKFL